jgi:hypothetical protein
MTPEEKAKQEKAVKDVRQKEADRKQQEAAENARKETLGGALNFLKRKDTPIKEAKGGAVKKYASGGSASQSAGKGATMKAKKMMGGGMARGMGGRGADMAALQAARGMDAAAAGRARRPMGMKKGGMTKSAPKRTKKRG